MARLEKEKVLEKIYYDVDEGFGSMRDLYEKARKVDVGITLDMVSAWMGAQPNKQTRNYKNYNSYAAPFPKYEFQIDLMDVTMWASWHDRARARWKHKTTHDLTPMTHEQQKYAAAVQDVSFAGHYPAYFGLGFRWVHLRNTMF